MARPGCLEGLSSCSITILQQVVRTEDPAFYKLEKNIRAVQVFLVNENIGFYAMSIDETGRKYWLSCYL